MDNLSNKIRVYLGREPDFREEIKLEHDGSKDYIAHWGASDKAKPTDEQLNALTSEATKFKKNKAIKWTRRQAYGQIEDQLDLLYKDMLAGKLDSTGEWAKKIKAVKDANPKE
tara:strand:- start:42 stop:380 length:339 start_codon:yes stop_codon:yes gene_type:complete